MFPRAELIGLNRLGGEESIFPRAEPIGRRRPPGPPPPAPPPWGGGRCSAPYTVGDTVGDTVDTVGDTVDTVGDTVDTVSDTVGDTVVQWVVQWVQRAAIDGTFGVPQE
eukprot:4836600-Pyramimonas_sp.AAC.1